MTHRRTKIVAAALLMAAFALSGLFGRRALSQEEQAQDPKMKMPEAEDMRAMMEAMKKWKDSIKPGAPHERLEHFVGTWKTTTKMWLSGPDGPALETQGTSEIKWVLGKRFLMEEHHGAMMMPDLKGGMEKVPYEGIGLTGYDNIRNLYTASWCSSLATNMLTMQGGADPSGKVFRMYGEMDEPMLGVYGRMVKYVTRIVDKDTHVFEILDLHARDDYRVFEITYARK